VPLLSTLKSKKKLGHLKGERLLSFAPQSQKVYPLGMDFIGIYVYTSKDAQKGFVGAWRFWVVVILENPCVK
jgi:hypothetical protein